MQATLSRETFCANAYQLRAISCEEREKAVYSAAMTCAELFAARFRSMTSATSGRHLPHCGRAPQRRKTSATLRASSPAAADNCRSFKALQMQTYIAGLMLQAGTANAALLMNASYDIENDCQYLKKLNLRLLRACLKVSPPPGSIEDQTLFRNT